MKDALVVSFLSLLPRRRVSRLMGRCTRLLLPGFLNRMLLRWYVGHYGVNLEECEGRIEDYPCLASFFVRALVAGIRPIADGSDALVSPVDGSVYAVGTVQGGRLPQGEHLDYAVSDLLAGDARYEGGEYVVLYLGPKDYHRVHSPREGRLLGFRYRPGRLWPVFPGAVRRISDLFARNERLILRLATDAGELAFVMVGAFGVGRMRLEAAEIITNTGQPAEDHQFEEPPEISRCQELGRFEMGSTVVLLFEPGRVQWQLEAGQRVRLGERIGRVLVPAAPTDT
jgi:phosphatidylserine decarboxylase